MLSLKCVVLKTIFAMVYLLFATVGSAQVIELGEASLHGKKDQPEAMTFVSRAPIDDDVLIPSWKVSHKIKEAIKDEMFKVSGAE